ncbi:MAG: ribonuclease HII [Christensenellales bacterium]|jgi:ribonuclease HII
MVNFDKAFLNTNGFIAGIDEAGRGPLAGPVCVACVIMPLDDQSIIEGVNDSKKLSEKKREELNEKIKDKAIDYSIVFIDEKTIDEINILNATKFGMKNALEQLSVKPDIVLIDAVKIEYDVPVKSIIKGDAKSYSIACASILAKVARDNFMKNLGDEFKKYQFEKHKGYGTSAHIKLLEEFGPCELHRKTFIKNFVK